ncbi:hypothetical protein LWF01_03030 [Saxibacter everestensis]|uniref:Uncharacterized protein n=1 Tax=Saxibacter everestensis TaxID=2909229 RepID=A0ABY8QUU8_9MICO|nr:hypothetical protein LWF01_03030 [Brevibacteriaceae bacterium ZFBP1038]
MPRLNGRRGAFQLLFSLTYLALGVSYLLVEPSRARANALDWLTAFVDVNDLGWPWLIAAMVAAMSAFQVEPLDRYGFGALAAIPAAWGCLYLIPTFTGEARTGWITTCLYWSLAVAVMVVAGMRNPVKPVNVVRVDQ